MQRRTSTTPVRVYTYGCHHKGILHNQELADVQFRKAHEYQNALILVEKERREKVRAVLGDAVDATEAKVKVDAINTEIFEIKKAALSANAGARKKVKNPEAVARLKILFADAKIAREALKAEKRDKVKDNPVIQAALEEINTSALTKVKELRGASGLYWGTYLIVEKSVDQQRKSVMDPEPSKFFTGEGRIGIQFQGGLNMTQIESDTRMRLIPIEGSKRSGGKYLAECWFRIGSEGVKPVWAKINVVVHRPLPTDSKITWAWLHREVRGRKHIYRLQLTVESTEFAPLHAGGSGRLAVDLGWRVANRGLGGLRVAVWKDDQGKTNEVRLDTGMLSALDYRTQLQGIEDSHFERVRGELADWIKEHPETVPQDFASRLDSLSLWKSAARLSAVIWKWKDARFPGDEQIFAAMNLWRTRHFWHYRDWALNQQAKSHGHRLDLYRNIAVQLVPKYKEIVLEKLNLTKFQRKAKGLEEGLTTTPQRFWKAMGAPSIFRQCLIDTAKKYGVTVTEIDPAMTTRKCNLCDNVSPWNQKEELVHTCTVCGGTWDQDENACDNMLDLASGPALSLASGPALSLASASVVNEATI